MHPEAREELGVRLKLAVLELAQYLSVTKACQEFNVPRSSFYRWKQKYEKAGRSGLYRARPIAYHHPCRTSPDVVEKILTIRAEYQFGVLRIMHYLDRYQGIKISESTVSRILKAHGLNWLQDSSQARSAYPKICQNGSWTPYAGGCEVPAAERSSGKDCETISIYRHR